MTRERPAADGGARRLAALAPRALLALVVLGAGLWPAIVEASLPGAAATVASDSRAVAAVDHLTLSAVADPTNASDFALFAGDELDRRALDQGDDAARFALGIAPEELDVAGLVLASRVRELGFHPLLGVELIDTESRRGPPVSYPKTRIGGLDLSEPFLQRETPRLSLGLRWGCGLDSCEIASEQRFDPLGLATVPGSKLDTMMRQRYAASKRAQADASNDLRELAWLLRPKVLRAGVADPTYYGDIARAAVGFLRHSLSAADRPEMDILDMGMMGMVKAPKAVQSLSKVAPLVETIAAEEVAVKEAAQVAKAATAAPEVVLKYKRNPKYPAADFEKQAMGQMEALRERTAGEIRQTIERVRAEGRLPEADEAVKAARRANPTAASGKAALHPADCCIGGDPKKIGGFGDKGINSSLGRQNRDLQPHVYEVVKDLPEGAEVPVRVEITVRPD